MTLRLLLYRVLIYPFLKTVFFIGRFFSSKIHQGWQMRRGQPWLQLPPTSRPYWFHCASGEFEYAAPVIRALKELDPTTPVLVTYFSPTYRPAIEKSPWVDMSCPLPWDEASELQNFIAHHQPKALAIARTDLWPEMLYQSKTQGLPTLLFSKTARTSGYFRPWNRFLLNALDQILVVSETDKVALAAQGLTAEVFGDTRYDQCFHRLAHPRFQELAPAFSRPVLLFASTWPEDERQFLPHLKTLTKDFQCLIVPHEPHEHHLRDLESKMQGVSHLRFSQRETFANTDVLLVDQVGILADLYRWSHLSYVGGSFGRGVHSVMESLAQGVPCLVGPKHSNNREALTFKNCLFGGDMMAVETVSNGAQLAQKAQRFLPVLTDSARSELQKNLEPHRGAARKVALTIQNLKGPGH